jgi:hypothetical protein
MHSAPDSLSDPSQGNWDLFVQPVIRKELIFLTIGPMIPTDGCFAGSSQETATSQQIMYDKKLRPMTSGCMMGRA